MAHIARDPGRYAGKVIGSGHCVPYTREVTGLPPTAHWREGGSVLDAEPGSAIATFDADGRYANATDGSSHAAILIEATASGLHVWDTWIGHPVAKRLIRFKGGAGLACDDGDAFSVVEVAA